jgi:hypothetical protein
MTLAAKADNRDILVLDQVDIGITIVVDAHLSRSSCDETVLGCRDVGGA